MLCDVSEIETEIDRLEDEMSVAAGLMQEHIRRNASVAQSQEAYAKETARIEKRYNEAMERQQELVQKRDKRKRRSRELKAFITALSKQPQLLTAWDERLWITLLDTATVNFDGTITFSFKGRHEIRI